jgi:hypothetical protein
MIYIKDSGGRDAKHRKPALQGEGKPLPAMLKKQPFTLPKERGNPLPPTPIVSVKLEGCAVVRLDGSGAG